MAKKKTPKGSKFDVVKALEDMITLYNILQNPEPFIAECEAVSKAYCDAVDTLALADEAKNER